MLKFHGSKKSRITICLPTDVRPSSLNDNLAFSRVFASTYSCSYRCLHETIVGSSERPLAAFGTLHFGTHSMHHHGAANSAMHGTDGAGSVPRPVAYAFSAEHAKVVHLVRHGQGVHNVEAALLGSAAYKKQTLMDARLDDTGKAQATALGQRIRDAHMQVDIVLVSPLTRALETASLMFPDRTVPFIAIEMCREAFGGHPCDQRRPISVIKREFGHVDYSHIGTDDDTWHNPDRRETVREVSIRADKFLAILRSRPERNIVVVSHGVFLETLLNRCALACVDDTKVRRFENCECRSLCLGGWAT